jgi:cadmium resistance protein CadD (predicted permease)
MGAFLGGCFSFVAIIAALAFFMQYPPVFWTILALMIIPVALGIRKGLSLRDEKLANPPAVGILNGDNDDDLEGDVIHQYYNKDEPKKGSGFVIPIVAAAGAGLPLTEDDMEEAALASDSEELQTYDELDTDEDEGDYR